MDDKMNQREADFEAKKCGTVPFKYPGDDGDTTPGRDNPEFNTSVVDLMELQSVRAAMRLAENVMAWSRTPAAGKLRMMAIQYILFGEPSVEEIMYRTGKGRSRVFQAIREVKCHCQPLLKIRRGVPLLKLYQGKPL
jgi:hypothetical protein